MQQVLQVFILFGCYQIYECLVFHSKLDASQATHGYHNHLHSYRNPKTWTEQAIKSKMLAGGKLEARLEVPSIWRCSSNKEQACCQAGPIAF